MPFIRSLRAALWPLLVGAFCAACGGEDDDVVEVHQQQQPERMGPAGCYLEAERRCDCELDEAACGDVGTWVAMGCASCAI